MEALCLLIGLVCVAYALYLHRDNDKFALENAMLRRSLHMIADGGATIRKYDGRIVIEEVK